MSEDGGVSVDGLARRCGWSARSLERRFRHAVGLPPKLFSRIVRFQRVFAAARAGKPDWAGLAIDCGYYDQAHLNRDFREFTGSSPAAYWRQEPGLASLFALPDPLSGSSKTSAAPRP